MQLINSYISYYHGNQLISGVVIHTPTAKLCVMPNIHQGLRITCHQVYKFSLQSISHILLPCVRACVYVTE